MLGNKFNFKNIVIIAGSVIVLASCGAIYTRMSKADMDVKVAMTNTIWLDPVASVNQTIFVQMRNTSGNPNFSDLNRFITAELVSKGYKIESDPDKAYYIMQVNVKSAVLTSKQVEGKDSAIPGAVIGGVGGSMLGKGKGQVAGALGGAVIGGLTSMAIDANTKDGYYDVIVDIRLGEKSKAKVNSADIQFQKQGAEGRSISSSYEETNRKYYTTVLRATSNMVNLTEQEGSDAMKTKISLSLAGLF